MLSTKAARLLQNNARVAVVTFSREAAHEIKHRISESVERLPRHLLIGTFHSLCFQQLSGARLSRALLSATEQYEMMRRAWAIAGLDGDWEHAVQAIEAAKTQLHYVPADDFQGRIYAAYSDLLQRHRVMDFNDLLLLAVRKMRDGSISPLRVEHMLVDEFQDTDELQYAWLCEHTRAGVIVTAVGDDDQCIYGWRNALGYQGMIRFEREHTAKRVLLRTNYRSHHEILRAAYRGIEHNPNRIDKDPLAARGLGGKVRFVRHNSRIEECEAIARACRQAPQRWAILARTHHLLNFAEGALSAERVPYRRIGSRSFWQKRVVNLWLSLLRCVYREDTLGIDAGLRLAGLSEDDIQRVHAASGNDLLTLPDAVTGLSRDMLKLYHEYRKTLGDWRKNATLGRDTLNVEAMRLYAKQAHKRNADRAWIDLAASTFSRLRGSISERLDYIDRKYERTPDEEGCTTLLTLHGAKGLEFDEVWIMAAEDGVLPNERALLEEERRLWFVGLTRARAQVIISAGVDRPVSQFVLESGVEHESEHLSGVSADL